MKFTDNNDKIIKMTLGAELEYEKRGFFNSTLQNITGNLSSKATEIVRPTENTNDTKRESVDEIDNLNIDLPTTKNGSFERNVQMEQTIITSDTIIIGTIASKSSLIINGAVKGDVYSENSLQLTGKVDGNIKANDVTFTAGSVKGDVASNGGIIISNSSIILGNLLGKSLEFDGKVKGDVRVNGHAHIKENAVIQGNLSAEHFTVDDGAKIIGFVEILTQDESSADLVPNPLEHSITFDDIDIPTGIPQSNGSDNTHRKPFEKPTAITKPTAVLETEKPKVEAFIQPNVVAAVVPEPTNVEKPEKKIEAAIEDTTEGEVEGEFTEEKQKMLSDLRQRMEKAKKNGQSI